MIRLFIDRILIFSGGGLISIVSFNENNAEIWVNWPEDVTLRSMKLVADMLNLMQKTKRRIVHNGLWVAFISEQSEYIVMAKVREKRYILATVGLLRRIAHALREFPEESTLIGERVVDLFREYFGINIPKVLRRWGKGFNNSRVDRYQ